MCAPFSVWGQVRHPLALCVLRAHLLPVGETLRRKMAEIQLDVGLCVTASYHRSSRPRPPLVTPSNVHGSTGWFASAGTLSL